MPINISFADIWISSNYLANIKLDSNHFKSTGSPISLNLHWLIF